MIPNIGDIFEVTHYKYVGEKYTYKLLSNNENDCFGDYKLSILKIEQPNEQPKYYKENDKLSFVDIKWFNEELTGRKIKLCTNYF